MSEQVPFRRDAVGVLSSGIGRLSVEDSRPGVSGTRLALKRYLILGRC